MAAVPMCDSIPATDPTVCSGRGTCKDYNNCECKDATGTFCEIPLCDGIPATSEGVVCSRRGNCTESNICECTHGYFGDNCENTESECTGQYMLFVELTSPTSYFRLTDMSCQQRLASVEFSGTGSNLVKNIALNPFSTQMAFFLGTNRMGLATFSTTPAIVPILVSTQIQIPSATVEHIQFASSTQLVTTHVLGQDISIKYSDTGAMKQTSQDIRSFKSIPSRSTHSYTVDGSLIYFLATSDLTTLECIVRNDYTKTKAEPEVVFSDDRSYNFQALFHLGGKLYAITQTSIMVYLSKTSTFETVAQMPPAFTITKKVQEQNAVLLMNSNRNEYLMIQLSGSSVKVTHHLIPLVMRGSGAIIVSSWRPLVTSIPQKYALIRASVNTIGLMGSQLLFGPNSKINIRDTSSSLSLTFPLGDCASSSIGNACFTAQYTQWPSSRETAEMIVTISSAGSSYIPTNQNITYFRNTIDRISNRIVQPDEDITVESTLFPKEWTYECHFMHAERNISRTVSLVSAATRINSTFLTCTVPQFNSTFNEPLKLWIGADSYKYEGQFGSFIITYLQENISSLLFTIDNFRESDFESDMDLPESSHSVPSITIVSESSGIRVMKVMSQLTDFYGYERRALGTKDRVSILNQNSYVVFKADPSSIVPAHVIELWWYNSAELFFGTSVSFDSMYGARLHIKAQYLKTDTVPKTVRQAIDCPKVNPGTYYKLDMRLIRPEANIRAVQNGVEIISDVALTKSKKWFLLVQVLERGSVICSLSHIMDTHPQYQAPILRNSTFSLVIGQAPASELFSRSISDSDSDSIISFVESFGSDCQFSICEDDPPDVIIDDHWKYVLIAILCSVIPALIILLLMIAIVVGSIVFMIRNRKPPPTPPPPLTFKAWYNDDAEGDEPQDSTPAVARRMFNIYSRNELEMISKDQETELPSTVPSSTTAAANGAGGKAVVLKI